MGNVVFLRHEFHDFNGDDIVVYDSRTSALILEMIEVRLLDLKTSVDIYHLLEMDDSNVYLLLQFIKYKNNLSDIILLEKVPSLFASKELIEGIVNFAKNYQIEELLQSCNSIDNVITLNAINKALLCSFIKKIANDIMRTFYISTPFGVKELRLQKSKHWLLHEMSMVSENQKELLSEICNLEKAAIYDNNILRGLKEELQGHVNIFARYNDSKTKIDEKLLIISAYFYALASCHFDRKENNISLALLHRSMDIYLQYVAKIEGLLDLVGNDIQYTDDDKKSNLVYLKATKNIIYKKKNSFFTQSQVELLDLLNDYRNNMLLAHGVFSVDNKIVNDLLGNCCKMITDIQGDTVWSQMVERMYLRQIIDVPVFIMFSSSLDTYFKKVN